MVVENYKKLIYILEGFELDYPDNERFSKKELENRIGERLDVKSKFPERMEKHIEGYIIWLVLNNFIIDEGFTFKIIKEKLKEFLNE